jgi:hypothetical protein
MPRSGTTLLSAMLDAHPNISIAPETHFLSEWMRRYRGVDIREDEAFRRFWAHFSSTSYFGNLGIPADSAKQYIDSLEEHDYKDVFSAILRLYAEKRDKKRWGEKTPTHFYFIDTLLNWYPSSKVIHMVRDPRAVVASRLKMPWAEKTVEDIAFQWQKSVDLFGRQNENARVYALKYEALILNSASELQGLCRFLEESYSDHMLDFWRNSDSLRTGEPWKANVRNPVEQKHLDKWRLELSQKQIAVTEHIAARGMSAFAYQAVAAPINPYQRLKVSVLYFGRRIIKRFARKTYLSKDIAEDKQNA